jgi:hypothetical protein
MHLQCVPSWRHSEFVMDLPTLFSRLWQRYCAMTPQAEAVHQLLTERGETVRNDHIALRTFNLAPINLDALASGFLNLGYVETGSYVFTVKKLIAKSYSHPSGGYPRVFISELCTEAFPPWLIDTLSALIGHLPEGVQPETLLTGEAAWPTIEWAIWERLQEESEYAAWVAAFGLCANHFTVSVNALSGFDSIAGINTFLENENFRLNTAGGAIKGGPTVMLEQSSTVADRVPWRFEGGDTRHIASCYYEFAKRYPDPDTGLPFDRFVVASADRIFESTDKQWHPLPTEK